jgi:hypothetical protein
MVIEPAFDTAQPFSEGLAAVRVSTPLGLHRQDGPAASSSRSTRAPSPSPAASPACALRRAQARVHTGSKKVIVNLGPQSRPGDVTGPAAPALHGAARGPRPAPPGAHARDREPSPRHGRPACACPRRRPAPRRLRAAQQRRAVRRRGRGMVELRADLAGACVAPIAGLRGRARGRRLGRATVGGRAPERDDPRGPAAPPASCRARPPAAARASSWSPPTSTRVFLVLPARSAARLRRIERLLTIALESGAAAAVIVLTKADLCADPAAARASSARCATATARRSPCT